jgi:hypothetical protein
VDARTRGYVGRSYAICGDGSSTPVIDDRSQRFEIARLIQPRIEHHVRPAARRQQHEEADGYEDEEPVDELDEPRGAGRGDLGLRAVGRAHGDPFDVGVSVPLSERS